MADRVPVRVAIVHDWLIGGGSERVVYELHRMFPDAPVYTSYCSDEWREKFDGRVVTGWLQHWPFSKLRKFLPILRIWWFSHLKLGGYDLIISSSGNGEAFGVRAPKGVTHVCYCHTPTHFYWRNHEQYLRQPGFGVFNPLARLGLRVLIGPLRRWDLNASKRVDYFIANSTHIQSDIKKYYGRDSVVIHPPVDIERFERAVPGKRSGYVTVGRQVPYKRFDIIVEACTSLDLPLTVVGRGPEHDRLVQMAGPTVTFDTAASDEAVANYMSSAQAFLFAAVEDFGVTPVEALAAGTPVVAYQAGGALDYVVPGKTGEFFAPQSEAALVKILKDFDTKTVNADELKQFAQNFATAEFARSFHAFLESIGR